MIGRNRVNLIVGWCGQFLFFVVLCPFSQVVSEWLENQILIPDWIYFYCPSTTLVWASVKSNQVRGSQKERVVKCYFLKGLNFDSILKRAKLQQPKGVSF